MVQLDLADIQGNILNGYGFTRAMHLFCSVDGAAEGRRFLQRLLDDGIQNAERWAPKPDDAVMNVALTFAGLERLGVEDAVARELPEAFREPIRRRAERLLGDKGDDAPGKWDLDTSGSHILVLVAAHGETDPASDEPYAARDARAADRLREKVDGVVKHASECGVTIGPSQRAQALKNQREHFG
jgi:hypothetical protein